MPWPTYAMASTARSVMITSIIATTACMASRFSRLAFIIAAAAPRPASSAGTFSDASAGDVADGAGAYPF